MNYIHQTLGQVLDLPPFHHYYQLPITSLENDKALRDRTFLILFQTEHELTVVNLKEENGQAKQISTATPLSYDQLLSGIAAVPLADLSQVQILEAPLTINLKQILKSYRKNPHILTYLKSSKNTAQIESLERTLELEELRLLKTYDPYRYATTSEVREREEDNLEVIPTSDYEEIQDFHPFLTGRQGRVVSVPATYTDRLNQATAKLEIMGWYIKDQRLKIRWKPKYGRKKRWRCSQVSVDIKTGHYFFNGLIYKDKQAPVFLKDLDFQSHIPPSYLPQLKQEFKTFQNIIAQQKKKALLRRQLIKT